MNITVYGSGRWASFLAWYASSAGHSALLCGRGGSASYESLKETRRNAFLKLPDSVSFTSDPLEAWEFSDIALVAIGAQQLRSFCETLKDAVPALSRAAEAGEGAGKTFVLCMKGLEENTGLRLTQVLNETLCGAVDAAVWVGPGHPQDFVGGVPNCMLIDSVSSALTRRLADALASPLIRFYYGEDLIGAEVGAAAKNVVGIAAGMLDGLDVGALKGVLMARGAREVSRLVGALGGSELTVYGICHLGDYQATLFSPYGHNRAFGECIVKELPYPYLAEGAATAFSLLRLSEQTGVELPICQAVARVIRREMPPRDILSGLFSRSTKAEFY
ncbi:MAG: glycerol-3-phosphate dehydrogenase [Oscillospiraceae bacterium]|jgi:glycerol-3-phosphate dehydrogenase (NAD(P)+)|nr:glycerol-3-phosphate dehydrogenase [Oscillospiraceae bacterium]